MNNSTVFEELDVSIVYLMVGTCSCTVDEKRNQLNGYLVPSNQQLTPTSLQILYCYSYSNEIFPTGTHQFENIQTYDEINALFKFLPLNKQSVESKIDTDNSLNTVLLFLFLCNSPIKSTIDAFKFSNSIQLSPL